MNNKLNIGKKLTRVRWILLHNLSLKILSVILAFVIWFLIASVNNPMSSRLFQNISVEIINQDSAADIDKAFDVISGDVVTVKVTERRQLLNGLNSSDLHVYADMENLNDMDAVPLRVSCDRPGVSWDEIELSPSSMKVHLEQKKQSEFAISVVTAGSVEKGYEIGSTEVLQGKTVQVAGPESLLNRIGRITASVNVNRLHQDTTISAVLHVYDKLEEEFTETQMNRIQIMNSSGVLLDSNQVTVKVILWEIRSGIPLSVGTTGTPEAGYRIARMTTVPETVSLVGTTDGLDQVSGGIVLTDAVSVAGANETVSAEVSLQDYLTELGIENIRLVADADPTITVTVEIEKTGDRTVEVPLSNLQLMNKPDDRTLTYAPADVISVRIHSDTENVFSLSLDQIKGTLDLSPCQTAGSYEIPVQIELPDGYELVSEVQIMVTSESTVSTQEIELTTEAHKE